MARAAWRTACVGWLLTAVAWAAPLDLATVECVGPGTPGVQGVPNLEVVGVPAVGQPLFDARITNGRPFAGAQLLVSTALDPVALPAFGATLWPGLGLRRFSTMLDSQGTSPGFTGSGETPAALDGLTFVIQGLVIDQAAMGGIAFTNGLSLTVGLGSAAAALFENPWLFVDDGGEALDGAVAVGDLDGNGVPDLVVTRAGGDVLVAYGLPDGSYLPGDLLDAGVGDTSDLELADLNGDGLLDLVAAGPLGVTLRSGLADGSLGPLVAAGVGGLSAEAVLVTDLNGDGVGDLAFTLSPSLGSFGLATMMGLGDGSFGPASVWPLTLLSYHLAAGDLNDDGVADLVALGTSGSFGQIFVLLGSGDGTFAPAVAHGVWPTAKNLWGMDVGDLNGDGRDDVAIVSAGGGALYVPGAVVAYLSLADGTLGPALVADGEVKLARGLQLHDLDGDGVLDALVRTLVGLTTLVGAGDGTFGEPLLSAAASSLDAVITQLPGDSVPDVIVLRDEGVAHALQGLGDGSFSIDGPSGWVLGGYPAVLADLNGDGLLDLGAYSSLPPGSPTSGALHFAQGLGDGTFGTAQVVLVDEPVLWLSVADVTGDGVLDALTIQGQFNFSAHLRPGVGDGTFGPPVELPTGGLPIQLEAVDLDGDGDLDIVGLSYYIDKAWVLHNSGDGIFVLGDTMDLQPNVYSLTVSDVDLDGIPDLVVPSTGANVVSVFMGDGDGGFAQPLVTPTTVQPWTALLEDLNEDALPDMVLTSFPSASSGFGLAPGRLEIRLGLGAGLFGPPTLHSIPAGSGPSQAPFADLNQDGAVDIVVGGPSGVTVLLGFGDGGFAPAQPFASPGGVTALGDVDNDGDVDIVAGSATVAAVLLNGLR